MTERFGGDWQHYHEVVRAWLPCWNPRISEPCELWLGHDRLDRRTSWNFAHPPNLLRCRRCRPTQANAVNLRIFNRRWKQIHAEEEHR